MLGMVAIPSVRYRTGALDWLPASRGRAERVVRFVVMVRAERFAVVDVECFVGKEFLDEVVIIGEES